MAPKGERGTGEQRELEKLAAHWVSSPRGGTSWRLCARRARSCAFGATFPCAQPFVITSLPTTCRLPMRSNAASSSALRIPAREFRQRLRVALRLAPGEFAPEHADDRCTFEERQVQRQRWNRTLGEADDEVASAPGDRAEHGLREVAADRVVDHVRPLAAG